MRAPPFGTVENPTQFDWRANWSWIKKYTQLPRVQDALYTGMQEWVEQQNTENEENGSPHRLTWDPGDPPWLFGYRLDDRVPPRKGSLDWYRPLGRCHWIAPFVLELVRCMYPGYTWIIFEGEYHTVITDPDRRIVFDILLFDQFSARTSLVFAGDDPESDDEQRFLNLKAEERHLAELHRAQHRPEFQEGIRDRVAGVRAEMDAVVGRLRAVDVRSAQVSTGERQCSWQ